MTTSEMAALFIRLQVMEAKIERLEGAFNRFGAGLNRWPEPRKPREWWIKEGEWMQIPYSKGEEPMRQRFAEGLVYEVPMANTIHVREVLPD
jgi:hypothetical protein